MIIVMRHSLNWEIIVQEPRNMWQHPLIISNGSKGGQATHFFSFECFKIKEELSILQGADYILKQDANSETASEKINI